MLARRDVLSIIIAGKAYEIKRERTATAMHLWVGPRRYAVQLRDPRSLRSRASADDGKGPRKLLAPMPGKVVRVLLKEESEVEAGQGVVVVEAMKMQNEIKSLKKGVAQDRRDRGGRMPRWAGGSGVSRRLTGDSPGRRFCHRLTLIAMMAPFRRPDVLLDVVAK